MPSTDNRGAFSTVLVPDEVCWACLGAGTVRYGGLAAEFQHDDPCPTCGGTGQPAPKET